MVCLVIAENRSNSLCLARALLPGPLDRSTGFDNLNGLRLYSAWAPCIQRRIFEILLGAVHRTGRRMMTVWQVLTSILAVLTAWVATQQWWVNREKLRLDLYARRYAVFSAARQFAGVIVTNASVDETAQREFLSSKVEAAFLFHADVADYLGQLFRQSTMLHFHAVSQKGTDADRASHIARENDLVVWFHEQMDQMEQVFSPYLRFQDLEGPATAIWRKLTRIPELRRKPKQGISKAGDHRERGTKR